MAKAPRPGVGTRKAASKAAAQVMRIRIGDETRHLAVGSIPIGEKVRVRKATGMPFEAFYRGGEDGFGEDSLAVLWWLAGRTTDASLTFESSCDSIPAGMGADDVDVTVIDPDDEDGDDPES